MKYTFTFLLILFVLSCSTEPDITPPIATAEIVVIATLTDSENNKPVANQNFLVETSFNEYDYGLVSQGTHQTDSNGVLSMNVRDVLESTVKNIVFSYGPEEDRQTISEPANKALSFSEPYDTLQYEIAF